MSGYIKAQFDGLLRGAVCLDLTEFLRNPVRAGIQRTLFSVLLHWPADNLLAFHLREDGQVAIFWPGIADEIKELFADDSQILEDYAVLTGDSAAASRDSHGFRLRAARTRLRRYTENPALLIDQSTFLESRPLLLNVEAFYDPARLSFYDRAVSIAAENVFFFVHDFMPFLTPEVDPDLDFAEHPSFMRYLHLLRRLHRIAFNSGKTRTEFIERISRGRAHDGPVLDLGADGLAPRGSVPLPAEKHFVVLGAIEARKGQVGVLRAFRALCSRDASITVTFVGKLVRLAEAERAEFLSAVSESGPVRWLSNVPDAQLAEIIRSARATIYASRIEGYGLPPLESLALGVPVITFDGLPSLERMEGGGRVVIESMAALPAAIELFLDNRAAQAKRAEIDLLSLPTWSGFAAAVHRWVDAPAIAGARPGFYDGRLLDLRRLTRLGCAVDRLRLADSDSMIVEFHREVLGRAPTAAQWQVWSEFVRRVQPASTSLCLAMLGHYAKEIRPDGVHLDLLAIAAADGQEGWLKIRSYGLARPNQVSELLRRLAHATAVPREFLVSAICCALDLPLFPSDGGRETLEGVVRRIADSPLLLELRQGDAADMVRVQALADNIADLEIIAGVDSAERVRQVFNILLQRDPSPSDTENYIEHCRAYGFHHFFRAVAHSQEAADRNTDTDSLRALIVVADNLWRSEERRLGRWFAALFQIAIVPDNEWFAEGMNWLAQRQIVDLATHRVWLPHERLGAALEVAEAYLDRRDEAVPAVHRIRAEIMLTGGLVGAFGDKELLAELSARLGEPAPPENPSSLVHRLTADLCAGPRDDIGARLCAAVAIEEGRQQWPGHFIKLGRAAWALATGWGTAAQPAEADRNAVVRLQQIIGLLDRHRSVSGSAFVSDVYRLLLRRPVDADGAKHWENELTNGLPREKILLAITNSEEFRSIVDGALDAVFLRLAIARPELLRSTGIDRGTHVAAAEGGRRQLLIDLSELVHTDAGTGIQRVTRGVLRHFLQQSVPGLRVEPAYLLNGRYRYARKFMHDFIYGTPGPHLDPELDVPVETRSGDILLALDLPQWHIDRSEAELHRLRQEGVEFCFVIHDLLPVRRPEWFPPAASAAFSHWLTWVAASSDKMICVSQSTATDVSRWLAERCPQEPDSGPVVSWFHLGSDIESGSISMGMPSGSADVLDRLVERPTFLVVGTIEPRKGHTQLLGAFELLWSRGFDANLAIVGKQGWMVDDLIARLRRRTASDPRCLWLEAISDEYLEKLYTAASALIAPSEGEGFGLPLIEAARFGVPVIARDLAVFREVLGDDAYYFSGTEPDVLADAVSAWVGLRDAHRAPLGARVQCLTWAESAQQLLRCCLAPMQ